MTNLQSIYVFDRKTSISRTQVSAERTVSRPRIVLLRTTYAGTCASVAAAPYDTLRHLRCYMSGIFERFWHSWIVW